MNGATQAVSARNARQEALRILREFPAKQVVYINDIAEIASVSDPYTGDVCEVDDRGRCNCAAFEASGDCWHAQAVDIVASRVDPRGVSL